MSPPFTAISPENVAPLAERPALKLLSAVNVFAPPAVIPVTAPVMPLNEFTMFGAEMLPDVLSVPDTAVLDKRFII